MAVLKMYCFEDTIGEVGLAGTNNITTANPRVGVASLALAGTAFNTLAVGASPSTIIVGGPWYGSGFAAVRNIEFREGATVHCGVGVDATGHVTVYGAAGTVIATSGTILTSNAWTDIEIKVVIHDTTGSVEVKVDGTVLTWATGGATNVDTKNGGTGVVDTIGVRKPNSSGATWYIDCFYMVDTTGSAPLNTYLGDVAVRLQLPDGNGDSSDWVGSDGNSVNNYQQVDELPSSSTDYNGTSATAKTDLYTFQDVPSTDVVLATQVVVYAAKSDAGTPPVMKPITKGDGGTVVEESAITLSTTYQQFEGAIRTTDPDGDALTPTNVGGMQIGVRSA